MDPEGCGEARGPRHPASPLLLRSLIALWCFGSHFSWAVGSVCIFAWKQRFFVCFYFGPPRPDPCENYCWFFLLMFGCFFCSPSLRFSSSSLQPSPSTRTPSSATSSRSPPAPVFFVRLAGGGGFLSVFDVVGLSLSLSICGPLALHVCPYC